MKLTRPAYIAFVAYVMMALVILLPFNIKATLDPNNETNISTQYVFSQRLFLVIMMVLPFAVSVYSINCFVVGKCWTWSYVHAVLVVMWVLLFLLGTVISTQSQIELFSGCDTTKKI